MPTVGTRTKAVGRGYEQDSIFGTVKSFNELMETVRNETGLDILQEANKVMMNQVANDMVREWYVENSAFRDEYSMEEWDDHVNSMNEMYINNRQAIVENSAVGSMNPMIGISFPYHKNILMNNVFDTKGAIPKFVAVEPKFTVSMETRFLIDTDGNEIDMFKNQQDMTPAMDRANPFVTFELAIPEMETTNIINAMGYTDTGSEMLNVSIATYVSAVQVNIYLAAGDINPETKEEVVTPGAVDVWFPVNYPFVPAYGEIDRTMTQRFTWTGKDDTGAVKLYTDVLTGHMQKNKLWLNSTGVIKAVKVTAKLDTSNALIDTCSVAWRVRTDMIEIPSATPMNVTISPEEVKDTGALYNVNQLSKIMSMLKLTMGNYKDDKIKQSLDDSFLEMPEDSKVAATFDFAPPTGQHYAQDPIAWRNAMFMDAMDTHVTNLLQVLNDPNMTVSVFGRRDLVRKITPTEYTYQTPSSIGPVEMEFTKTVTTSDKRTYQFVASDKLRGNNNLITILNPRNTDRFVYRVYDYQTYVSNEIRNKKNPSLPAVHIFERWIFKSYQPVQARIMILNPTGLREEIPNTDPIGAFSRNDFNSNKPYVPAP